MQLSDNPISVEHRPRLKQRRQRQFMRMPEHFTGFAIRQLIDPDDLDREVVDAAALKGVVDDEFCSPVQVVRILAYRTGDEARGGVLVNPVGRQQKEVALLNLERQIVDFALRINTQRATQVIWLRLDDQPMTVGK